MTADDHGGYQLPDSLRMLQQTVRDFIQREIIPLEQELDYDAIALPPEEFERLSRKTREMGLWALEVPEQYGGAGLNCFATTVAHEELVQHRAGLYLPAYRTFWSPPPYTLLSLIQFATPEQAEAYVLPTARGEREGWIAITEPSGGSDPARAIQTRAVRDGDDWVINGSKVFISAALEGDYGLIFARTDPSVPRGVTAFLVDNGTPGLTIRPLPVIRAYYPAEVFFDDVRVPDSNRVGEEHQGWELLATRFLAQSRIPYSSSNLGVAVAAQRLAVEYAKQRETFGAPLASRQAIQWMLVDNEVDIRAGRWLTWQAAWAYDEGRDFRTETSIAKLFTSEALGRVVDNAVQIHGGYGVTRSLPLERWYREARVRRIGEGPSEVQRMVIARSVLGRKV